MPLTRPVLLCAAAVLGGFAGAATAQAQVPAATPEIVAPVRWSPSGAVTDGGYRWSLTRGAIDLGLHFEARPAASHPADARFDSAAPPGATLPALSLGLRSVAAEPATASSLAERALGGADSSHAVSKVGIEWKPAQSRVFVNQGLGFRLGGDDRITMRLRKGSLGIYMKRDF